MVVGLLATGTAGTNWLAGTTASEIGLGLGGSSLLLNASRGRGSSFSSWWWSWVWYSCQHILTVRDSNIFDFMYSMIKISLDREIMNAARGSTRTLNITDETRYALQDTDELENIGDKITIPNGPFYIRAPYRKRVSNGNYCNTFTWVKCYPLFGGGVIVGIDFWTYQNPWEISAFSSRCLSWENSEKAMKAKVDEMTSPKNAKAYARHIKYKSKEYGEYIKEVNAKANQEILDAKEDIL